MEAKTIVAPMTPSGVSAVAGIRVSGPDSLNVIHELFSESKKSVIVPRKAYHGTARDSETKKFIDDLVYIFYQNPASYTGEDAVEFFTHGNPLIVRDLLRAILKIQNVRLAEPGEFTKRAFLNGKMDLIQAGAVADLIHSTSQAALANARKMFSGVLSSKIKNLSQAILDFSSRVELDVDFTEEEADPDIGGWDKRLAFIARQIEDLLLHFKNAEAVNRLPLAVIYGAPNAGKSSLVNALLAEERLLVSHIAGTTRDFVEVRLMLPRGEIRLIDTAGLSETPTSELDALSMKKSREILESADLKIHLIAADSEEFRHLQKTSSKSQEKTSENEIVVISKSDLIADFQAEQTESAFFISSKSGQGLAHLKQYLNDRLYTEATENAEDFFITGERERICLETAAEGVRRARELVFTNPAVELIAFEMQTVRHALASITGEIVAEDVLQNIFAGFCIGK